MTGKGTGILTKRHAAVQLRHKREAIARKRHANFRRAQANMTKAEIEADSRRAIANHAAGRQ